MTNYETDEPAIALLVRDFPDVPSRIIASVLASYLPITATIADAISACRSRIVDACAA
jgi:hypothetical protein